MRGRVIRISLLVVLGALIVWGIGFFIQSWAMLDISKITALPQSSVVYDGGGEAVEIMSGSEDRTHIALKDVPKHVVEAFLAAEDARFYTHHGIDLYRVGGAVLNNIKSMSYGQGASTITQQLIKLTHLSSDKTIERKAREAILAVHLEMTATKDEILEAYLNTVYFGAGAYGVDAAARRYLGIGARDLTLSQGAMLAGIIKSPSNYAPHINLEKALSRRDCILESMAEYGYISEEEAETAKAEKIEVIEQRASSYAWYTEYAANEAAGILNIGYDELLSGGYRLFTALDAGLQISAGDVFNDDSLFPPPASDGEEVQAAMVVVDVSNGEVVAMVGGRNRTVARGLNRAGDIERQPGSAFKPVSVYAAAVDRFGYVPSDFINDDKREFDGGYSPNNVSDSYNGLVTLREALSRSLNVATVDLIDRVGVKNAKDYAGRAGLDLSGEGDNLSLALGSLTKGVSPLSLAAAYAPLANGGTAVSAHLIRRIEDASGNVIFKRAETGARVMSNTSARLVTDMLLTAARSGTARALGGLPFAVAGKTGTVGEGGAGNRDVWNVAYTPKLALCVWMGFDNPDMEHCMSNSVTGSSHPTRLAAKYMDDNRESFDGGDFETPSSLVTVPIDKKALSEKHRAMLVSEFTPASFTQNELFPASGVPVAVSDAWQAPSPVFDLNVFRDGAEVVISFTAVDDFAAYRIYRQDDDGDVLLYEASAPAGDKVEFRLVNPNDSDGYYVLPIEKTLLAEGIELFGRASQTVYEARRLNWSEPAGEITHIEQTEQIPLFG